MRAAAFVRYHSGDGFGHLGWAFDWSARSVNAGAVENHSGGLETPAADMGFWSDFFADPMPRMREHRYDDLKYVDIDDADPVRAYRVVLWVKTQPFRALHRNCLDDTYDVLRAFGLQHLDPPSHDLFPKEWFARFQATQAHVAAFQWRDGANASTAASDGEPDTRSLQPLCPPWRRPWHPDFHLLNVRKLLVR
jgi:hypothetical protein